MKTSQATPILLPQPGVPMDEGIIEFQDNLLAGHVERIAQEVGPTITSCGDPENFVLLMVVHFLPDSQVHTVTPAVFRRQYIRNYGIASDLEAFVAKIESEPALPGMFWTLLISPDGSAALGCAEVEAVAAPPTEPPTELVEPARKSA